MWLIHRTRCKKSNLSPWFPSLFSELSFCHSFVVYIFPYLSVSIMKAHLLLLFLQASLPNSLLDTAQMLFHKLLKAFRQKAKLGGMLLDWASLLVLTSPFLKCQDVTVFALPSIFPASLPVPPPQHLAAALQPLFSAAVLIRICWDKVCCSRLPAAHRWKKKKSWPASAPRENYCHYFSSWRWLPLEDARLRLCKCASQIQIFQSPTTAAVLLTPLWNGCQAKLLGAQSD